MCGFGSLVDDTPYHVDLKPAGCRAWSCEEHGPVRRARCEIEARLGQPTRFLTLTVRPTPDRTPTQRRKHMGEAWATLRKRLQRLTGDSVEFYCAVEATKAGEPHFHILLRGKYLDQKILSRWWEELTGSPIVYIEAVNSAKKASTYIHKYVGKALHKFGNCKRYWRSKGWVLPDPQKADEPAYEPPNWRFNPVDLESLTQSYLNKGYWLVPSFPDPEVRRLIIPPWQTRPPPTAPPVTL